MSKRILNVLYYITLAEIVLYIYLLFSDLNNNSLELGALVLVTVDGISAIYYVILAWVIKRLINKDKTALTILVMFLNMVPIVFYLHLLDIV